MIKEIVSYLNFLKEKQYWDEEQSVSTVTIILNKYMGAPPSKIVVDGKEIGIQEVLALQRAVRGLEVGNLVADQSTDREVTTHERHRVDVEQRLGVDVARDVVRLVQDTVERETGSAFRLAQCRVLVRVPVGADVGLDVAPREWRNVSRRW
jgi:hypothetical protein